MDETKCGKFDALKFFDHFFWLDKEEKRTEQ